MADNIFRNRRRGRAFWLFLPLLLLLYLLLFPHPGGRETLVRPVWMRELSDTSPLPGNGETPWYFRAADRFGYADLSGNLYYVGRTLYNLSLSDKGFINYGSVPDYVVFMNPRGEFQYSVKSHGYPLLDPGGRILYSINTARSGMQRIDADGQVLWSLSFPTLITTIAPAGDECFLGLMDGRALLVGSEGEVLYQLTSAAGRIPVVLASAVSEDRNHFALISGIDPQFLAVIERRAGEFVSRFEEALDSDFRREVRLEFGADRRFLFYEIEGGLGVLDVRKSTRRRYPALGVLESLDSSSEVTAAAFRTEEGSRLLLFRPPDSVLVSRGTGVDRLYVRVFGRSLVLGFDGVILRADLLEG
jgi:hypothetical protein